MSASHRLQRTAPADGLLVDRDRLLRRLSSGGELVEIASSVKVRHGGHPARIRVGRQVRERLSGTAPSVG
jgi:hypothetical protein